MIKKQNLTRRKFLEQILATPIVLTMPRLIKPPLINSHPSMIKYIFQKGDTLYSLKEFYGDPRNSKKIAGNLNPREIPLGTEIAFIVDYKKFKEFGLRPNDENWHEISRMSGDEFSNFIKVFGYKEHGRLVKGLVPGNYEKEFAKQLANIENFRNEINLASKEYGIDPLYHAAIGITESGLKAKTISPSGPIGAWGLSKYIFNKSHLGDKINPYNEKDSTQRSASYLSYLRKKYSKIDVSLDSKLWVTAYNAGETVVNRLLRETEGIENFDKMLETRFKGFGDEQAGYVKKIESNLNKISEYFTVKNGRLSRI